MRKTTALRGCRFFWRALFLVILIFLLLEGMVRVILAPTNRYQRLFINDDYLGISLRPNRVWQLPISIRTGGSIFSRFIYTVHINSQGFRGREMPPITGPDRGGLRIACLGDSITFGWGVDEEYTYPAVLENLLRMRSPYLNPVVLNAGVPNYSSRQGLIQLDRKIIPLNPDIVTIALGFNDTTLNFRPFGTLQDLPDSKILLGSPGHWVPYRHFLLPTLMRQSLLLKIIVGYVMRVNHVIYMAGGKKKGDWLTSSRVSPEEYEANIREMITLCQLKGIRVILIDAWPNQWMYRKKLETLAREYQIPLLSQYNVVLDAKNSPDKFIHQPKFVPFAERAINIHGRKTIERDPVFYFVLDYVHPNEIINLLFAEKILAAIDPNTIQDKVKP